MGTKTQVASFRGEVLKLTKISRSEMGSYLCIASNGVPPSVSKRISLSIHFHPVIQVPNQLVGAPLGTDVQIECHVEASPKSINYWIKDTGEMIVSSTKYHVQEHSKSMYETKMTMIVRKFQKEDVGSYRCIAKNSLGEVDSSIRLYEIPGPSRKNPSNKHGIETNDILKPKQVKVTYQTADGGLDLDGDGEDDEDDEDLYGSAEDFEDGDIPPNVYLHGKPTHKPSSGDSTRHHHGGGTGGGGGGGNNNGGIGGGLMDFAGGAGSSGANSIGTPTRKPTFYGLPEVRGAMDNNELTSRSSSRLRLSALLTMLATMVPSLIAGFLNL